MKTTALILFAHGARDPRWAAPFQRLRELASAQLPDTVVELAFLELMTPRLPELVGALAQQGVTAVTVVPVFLGQGGHVLRDLPEIIEKLRTDHPGMQIKVVEAAGENADVLNAITAYCVASLKSD